MPDRSVETVAAWFVAHPSIELISRDGSSEYAAAALKGAPQAIQVSDKWHVVKNLAKALQVLLTHHFTAQRKKKTQEVGKQKESAFSPERERRLSPQQARIQNVHREDRLARYEQVIALAKQGMSQELIARLVGVGHSTVSRWLRAETFPERKPREQASQLDPYRWYVQKRLSQGYHNLMGMYRELQSLGYQGSYATLHAQFAKSSSKTRAQQALSSPLTPAPFTGRFFEGASEQGRKHGGKKKGESLVSDTIPGMNVPKYRRETCLTGKHYRNGNSRCQRIWGI